VLILFCFVLICFVFLLDFLAFGLRLARGAHEEQVEDEEGDGEGDPGLAPVGADDVASNGANHNRQQSEGSDSGL